MAIFRGVNGVARKVKNQYRGINGVARKIKVEWRGISGVARKVFTDVLMIYDNGDECKSLTGGWLKAGYSRGNAIAVKNTNNITLSTNASGAQTVTMFTANKIDLRGYSKLIAQVEYTTTTTEGIARLIIDDAIVNAADSYVAHKSLVNSASGKLILDISNYQSSYYIGIQLDKWSDAKNITFKVTEIWLEK